MEQYWRRRAGVLAGVAGVVALMGWACTAGGEEDSARVRSTSATPSPGVPTALATVTVTATERVAGSPGSGASGPRGACAPESLVVAMKATDSAYAAGERPRFMVTVVNIGRSTCTLDAGSGEVDLSITSGGDRVWSSAACARDERTSRHKLRRGVPYIRTITWDRRRATGGCRVARVQARPGTYVAALKSPTGTRRAPKQVFTLH